MMQTSSLLGGGAASLAGSRSGRGYGGGGSSITRCHRGGTQKHATAAAALYRRRVSGGGGGGGGGSAPEARLSLVSRRGSGSFTVAARGVGGKSSGDDAVDDRFYSRPDEAASPRADDDLFWDPADLEGEDAPLVTVDDAELEEDDDDDDSWFFVPEGSGVDVNEEDLFVVGEDYDDDSFGFVPGFVQRESRDDEYDDEADAAAATVARGGKSNRRKLRTSRDAEGSQGKGAGGGEVGGEQAELSPAQVKAAAQKEKDTARMLRMGVPESLLRQLEEEKEAVDKYNVKKSAENARRTHKRLTIVAGSLARRKILSPSGLDTRPMMGMVRGATFDMIMSLIGSRSNTAFPPNSRWLDLFAGTG